MDRWSRLNSQVVACAKCPRLREYCEGVAKVKRRAYLNWDYWGKPVPNFGDPTARLLIVGLAPAAHGANRTGRLFTGDRSGDWLYRALHKAGFANRPDATSVDDGLTLYDCAITAVCHCAPPDNKPTSGELAQCQLWLERTLDLVQPRVLLALGQIAWNETVSHLLRCGWLAGKRPKFRHGALTPLVQERWLAGSYHPSQQNTFTGRLTEPMFDEVFSRIVTLLNVSA